MPTCPSPEILAAPAEGAPGGDRYFLFLGRFDPVKNPVLAVEAMARLKASGPVTCRLRMVGSGGLRGEVEAAVEKHGLSGLVSLEPAAPFERVPELMRSAYALVVPSRIEGFNTTILEAAHFGVPSVASDTAGISDFVRERATGLLFAENDAGGMARALMTLMADSSLRDALGRAARVAAEPYRPDRVADSFLSELDAVVPGSGFRAHAREAVAWN